MLTPILEKLILSGKAAFKTYVVGGTEKHILNVPNDRFIIITDIVYFSNLNVKAPFYQVNWANYKLLCMRLNTQLKVFSEKSNNSFVFRNSFSAHPKSSGNDPDFWVFPNHSPIKLDTYLIHEADVSFTFSWVGNQNILITGLSRTDVPAYAPPFDYGKVGQIGAEPVTQSTVDLATGLGYNFQGQTAASNPLNGQNNLEFVTSVDSSHYPPNILEAGGYPLLHVSYVEIKGNPTNIEMTS